MSNLDSYIRFSKYYDLMIRHRNHYQSIAGLLDDLLPHSNSKILDAACGQGNPFYFNDPTHRTIYGNDGSQEMLCVLKSNRELFLKYKAVFNHNWEDLDKLFEKEKNFDLVFFLGNSISHVESLESLEEILRRVYNGISKGGKILFDFRNWQYDPIKKSLFEKGRVENSNRKLFEANDNGKKIAIYDNCHYENERQIIEYFIEEDAEVIDVIKFSYLMIEPDSIVEMCARLNFKVDFIGQYKSYSYHIILGAK